MRGGVEKVTKLLSDFFRSKGHSTFFLSFLRTSDYNEDTQLYLPNSNELFSNENFKYFETVLLSESIDIIINQAGLKTDISEFSYYSRRLPVKLYSVVHNSLLSTAVNFEVVFNSLLNKYHLSFITPILKNKIIKEIVIKLYAFKKKKHYSRLVKNSDVVVVLAEAYLKELAYILKTNRIPNAIAIPNPIILHPCTKEKKKELLYVGRVNRSQKKIDLLLEVWETIYHKNPDWKLNIVGGGEDLEELRESCKEKRMENVYFHGFKDPINYYEDASIFCMTSSFEGLPMTIIEAMSYGVVPILFDSFGAASDLITSGKNGILIPAFNIDCYVSKLQSLMDDSSNLANLRQSAIQSSTKYDMNCIGEKWLKLFNELIQS